MALYERICSLLNDYYDTGNNNPETHKLLRLILPQNNTLPPHLLDKDLCRIIMSGSSQFPHIAIKNVSQLLLMQDNNNPPSLDPILKPLTLPTENPQLNHTLAFLSHHLDQFSQIHNSFPFLPDNLAPSHAVLITRKTHSPHHFILLSDPAHTTYTALELVCFTRRVSLMLPATILPFLTVLALTYHAKELFVTERKI